ncbi:MAG: hypothetical protein JWM21_3283 [Acidobacteria bacterium]|nr:hypothetical protein [Acidobacteriota bacterium]
MNFVSKHVLLLALLLAGSGRLATLPLIGATMKVTREAGHLRLRGRVLGVTLAGEDKHGIEFHLRLSLELINSGPKPVIILQRKPWLGSITLARSPEDAAASRYLYLSSAWPSVYRGGKDSKWENLQQRLDQRGPPPELTRTLRPGETFQYETDATLYIEKRGNFDKTSVPWDEIRRASPTWLQVTLETWPVNIEPTVDPNHPEFGMMLQRRWWQFGQLQLERLTSDPMLLDFSLITFATDNHRDYSAPTG